MRLTLSILILTFFSTSIFAQSYWQKVDKSAIESYRSGERVIFPTEYETFTLDADEMKKEFNQTPSQALGKTRTKTKIISIPFPSGELVDFDMWEASVMAPKLSLIHI